jgi:hypothetical protein
LYLFNWRHSYYEWWLKRGNVSVCSEMNESLIKKAREVAAAALAEWKKKLSASDWKVEQEKVRQKVEVRLGLRCQQKLQ